MPGHEHAPAESHRHDDAQTAMPAGALQAMDAPPAGRERVQLNISGMT